MTRLQGVLAQMAAAGAKGLLVTSNIHLFYLTGRVYSGFFFLSDDGQSVAFSKKQCPAAPQDAVALRKVEQIPALLAARGLLPQGGLMLEDDYLSKRDYDRVAAAFDGIPLLPSRLRAARAVKMPDEIDLIRSSCRLLEQTYARAPLFFKAGMTDRQLAAALESQLLAHGHLGQFKIFGESMEIGFGGSVLAGDNAAVASPYDFAIGGAGRHPSMPVGACGAAILPGQSVLLDMGANFFGYSADVSRTFSAGDLPPLAYTLHDLSIAICRRLAQMGVPGTPCAQLYAEALAMVERAGAAPYYMEKINGTRFVGHGVGMEINEMPVVSAGSRDVLAENMVLALEPKFVLPGVGPLGVENTYVVTQKGLVSLSESPMEIVDLCGKT